MTNDEGLPRRPWFRHQVYAPGFYTGYGVKTLPGIREAIEQRNWEEASERIELVAQMLIRVSDALERAVRILEETHDIAQCASLRSLRELTAWLGTDSTGARLMGARLAVYSS